MIWLKKWRIMITLKLLTVLMNFVKPHQCGVTLLIQNKILTSSIGPILMKPIKQ